jgi:hypothetical protein
LPIVVLIGCIGAWLLLAATLVAEGAPCSGPNATGCGAAAPATPPLMQLAQANPCTPGKPGCNARMPAARMAEPAYSQQRFAPRDHRGGPCERDHFEPGCGPGTTAAVIQGVTGMMQMFAPPPPPAAR